MIEAKLDAWLAAKRNRDFATSDRLRDELRTSKPRNPRHFDGIEGRRHDIECIRHL